MSDIRTLAATFLACHDAFILRQAPATAFAMRDAADALRRALAASPEPREPELCADGCGRTLVDSDRPGRLAAPCRAKATKAWLDSLAASPEPEGERAGTICPMCHGDATATCHAVTAVSTPAWPRIEATLMAVPWCDDQDCGIGTCHVHKLAVERALRDEFCVDAHPPERRCLDCANRTGFNCDLTGLSHPGGLHRCQDWRLRATSERREQDQLPEFLNTICPVCGVTATYHRELGGYLCPLPRGPGEGGCATVTPWSPPPASPPSPAPACEPCHGTGRLSGHYEGARCRPCNGTGRAPAPSSPVKEDK